MPTAKGIVRLKGKVKCPHCNKEFEAELENEVEIEFDMSDYVDDWKYDYD